MKFIIFFNLFFLSKLFAADFIKPILVKGKVVFGSSESSLDKLIKSSELKEGDIVITGKKSIAKLRYPHGGKITIGPDSKVTLGEIKKGKTSGLNLLKGTLRASYPEKVNEDFKLVVGTKSASMGIRGTDFLVVYNDINNITSTVSYHGNVHLIKNSKNFKKESLDSNSAVIVRPGRFSGVYKTYDLPSTPTKINPTQYNTLKGIDENERTNSFETNVKTTDFTPRPGGYLDLDTSIYVAPPKNAKFDEDKQVYIPPKEYGSIDESGDYIPPLGLILDPLKGFLVLGKAIANGAEFVGEKLWDGTAYVGGGVLKGTEIVGKTFGEGADFFGNALVDSTSAVGETLAQGTKVLGDSMASGMGTVVDGAVAGTKIVGSAVVDGTKYVGSTVLDGTKFVGREIASLAMNMNEQLYDNLLVDVHKFIKSNEYLSKIKVDGHLKLLSNSVVRDEFFAVPENILKKQSNLISLQADFAYKKYVVAGWFFTPVFKFKKLYSLKNESLVNNENFIEPLNLSIGADGGLEGKLFSFLPTQTYASFFASGEYREEGHEVKNVTHAKDWKVYLSERMRISDGHLLEFNYGYTQFVRRFGEKGSIHHYQVADYFHLGPTNLFISKFNYQFQKGDLIFEFEEYFRKKGLIFGFAPEVGLSYKMLDLRNSRSRSIERQYSYHLNLLKELKDYLNFNISSEYRVYKNNATFNGKDLLIGLGLDIKY